MNSKQSGRGSFDFLQPLKGRHLTLAVELLLVSVEKNLKSIGHCRQILTDTENGPL